MKKRQMKCKHCGSGDYISLDAAAHFDNELGDWVLGTMYDEEIACNNIACMRDMRGSMDWDDFEDFEVDVATITPIVAPPEAQMQAWAVAYRNGATKLGMTEWVTGQAGGPIPTPPADELFHFTGSQPGVGAFEVRRDAQDFCIFVYPQTGGRIERWCSRWQARPESLEKVYEILREYGFAMGGEA